MYKVPEFKISDFVESLPIKVKFLNSADSRPKHPDNAAVSSLKGANKIHFEFENIHCTVQRVRRAIKFFTRIWEQEIYNSQLKGYNLNLLFSCTFCIPTLYLIVICNLTKSS